MKLNVHIVIVCVIVLQPIVVTAMILRGKKVIPMNLKKSTGT